MDSSGYFFLRLNLKVDRPSILHSWSPVVFLYACKRGFREPGRKVVGKGKRGEGTSEGRCCFPGFCCCYVHRSGQTPAVKKCVVLPGIVVSTLPAGVFPPRIFFTSLPPFRYGTSISGDKSPSSRIGFCAPVLSSRVPLTCSSDL